MFKKLTILPLLLLSLSLTFSSCIKDKDGTPDAKAGTPVAIAITPDNAAGGEVVTINGTGLGDIRSIVFDNNNVPAQFYSTLNTETNIVFRVPDTAFGGPQNIILTNSAGRSVTVPFKVLAFPGITDASTYSFTGDTEITLTGNNLDDVSKVVLTGSTDEATILSASRKSLVIRMPASEMDRVSLDITNATGTITTTHEFINVDKALKIFTDSYGPDFGDGSWGDAGFISTAEYRIGSASIGKKYAAGNWHLINFVNWWPSVASDPNYKFMSFWIKGASKDYSLYITSDKAEGGFGNFDEDNKVNVPANVWTYYKIPLSQLGLWATGSPMQQLGFRIQGPDGADETFYFDEILISK